MLQSKATLSLYTHKQATMPHQSPNQDVSRSQILDSADFGHGRTERAKKLFTIFSPFLILGECTTHIPKNAEDR